VNQENQEDLDSQEKWDLLEKMAAMEIKEVVGHPVHPDHRGSQDLGENQDLMEVLDLPGLRAWGVNQEPQEARVTVE